MKWFKVICCVGFAVSVAGAETRVRIFGMQDKSEQEMLLMMGDRLTHVRSSPALPALADDAAFILRHLLERDGYEEAVVEWKIAGPEEIHLNVRHGLRLALREVNVTGAPPGEEIDLVKFFKRPSRLDREFGGDLPPYREESVDRGLQYVIQELNSRGYWQAEAEIAKRDIDPATGAVDLEIAVRAGPLFSIGRPVATSSEPSHAARAVKVARPFAGLPATTSHINEMRLAVEATFTSSGYPDASVEMSNALEGRRFIPQFTVELGRRVRLSDIRLEGLERTKPQRIRARLGPLQGEWYDEAAMNVKLREFLSTGAFRFVRVDAEPAGEGRVDAVVEFEEAKAREVSLGLGVGSYQGVIVRAGYTDRNLYGHLLGLNAGFELSLLGLLGEVQVTNPWLFNTDTAAAARWYAMIYNREGYNTYETGLEGKLSRKFGEHYSMELLAAHSLVNISASGLPFEALGETVYNHPRLRFTQKLDFRDNPVLPTKGWHLESPVQLGAAVGDVSTSYVQAGLTGGWYRELGSKTQIGVGGELGLLIPSAETSDLPIDLRLFNGGARSVRSFPERELGPSLEGYPVGGEGMWNVNFEVIQRITESLRGVAFIDAGSLSREFSDIVSSDVELAAGLGIRFNLPIGPVRFEYGYNLTRDRGEPAGTFHFAIGYAY